MFDGRSTSARRRCPGMYERTISLYTFSKTYAMTGLRLGYVARAGRDAARPHEEGALLHREQRRLGRPVRRRRRARRIAGRASPTFRDELQARRELFYAGIRDACRAACFSGAAADGRVLRVPEDRSRHGCRPTASRSDSLSWAMTEYLISQGTIGCVPGVDFGANGEGYLRFCFARDRRELTGALESMRGAVQILDRLAVGQQLQQQLRVRNVAEDERARAGRLAHQRRRERDRILDPGDPDRARDRIPSASRATS